MKDRFEEMMRRRDFVRLGAAALATASLPSVSAAADRMVVPRLRIGSLSDVHLRDSVSSQKLERALQTFRKGRVDGVLICGDLTENGVLPQLEELAEIWERVFPGSKGADGSHVERLFHYGDHDNRGHWLSGEDANVRSRYGWSEENLAANACFRNSQKHWERVFGEPWQPIVRKNVKGYDFILSHYTKRGWKSAEGLEKFLQDFHPAADRPFFYSQHRVFRNTVCRPAIWGQDDGTVGKLLSAFPNCCAFCGHSHMTAMREDSIWQGDFTAVQVPSLRYVTHENGHENRINGSFAEQGMMLSVYDDRMYIHRLDFANQARLAPSWIVPFASKERPYAYEVRRRQAAVPEFPPGARMEATIRASVDKKGKKCKMLSLSFPVVNGLSGGVRAYDYEVTVCALCFGGDVTRVVRRYFSPKCDFAPSADVGKIDVSFPLDKFKKWLTLKSPAYGALHVEVRPCEVFGGAGKPLVVDLTARG